MGDTTKIEWCRYTFNPWRGCSKIAPGCANCYAAREAKRFPLNRGVWGDAGTRVLAAPSMWHRPLKWNRDAANDRFFYDSEFPLHDEGDLAPYERPRVFCASLADVFEAWGDGVVHNHKGEIILESYLGDVRDTFSGTAKEWKACNDKQGWHSIELHTIRKDLFKLIDATPGLDWLLLTKRPENIVEMWPRGIYQGDQYSPCERDIGRRSNVWIGTSIACRDDLANIYKLRECRDFAPILFLSIEPLIEDLGSFSLDGIDWVIVGGESGPGSRPCAVEYIDEVRRLCNRADVPCFIKQLGSMPVTTNCNLWDFGLDQLSSWGDFAASARIQLNDDKGGDWNEWPEGLRVREFPTIEVHS